MNANLRGEWLHPTLSDRFIADQRATGKFRSDATARTYGTVYQAVQKAYPELRANEILTLGNLTDWLRAGRPEWSENTLATYRKALVALIKWSAKQGVCPDFVEELRDGVQVQLRTHRVSNWLEPGDLGALIRCPLDGSPQGDRDSMVCRLGALTGLRRFELAGLSWTDIDFRGRTIHVRHGKGDKQRFVGLLPDLEVPLRDWRGRAAEDLGAIPTSHPVLPVCRKMEGTLWWDHLQPRTLAQQLDVGWTGNGFAGLAELTIYRVVYDCGLKVGIDNLGPHDLRRTFAGLLEKANIPVQEIAAQLGHASVDTTVRYLAQNPAKRANALSEVRFGL